MKKLSDPEMFSAFVFIVSQEVDNIFIKNSIFISILIILFVLIMNIKESSDGDVFPYLRLGYSLVLGLFVGATLLIILL